MSDDDKIDWVTERPRGVTHPAADAFVTEHYPNCAELVAGGRGHFCQGCSAAVGEYVNWPCAHIWGAADIAVRLPALLAEAERRGAERGWDEGRESVGRDFLQPLGDDGQRPASNNPYRKEFE